MLELSPNQRIYDVVKGIKEGYYKLPSIQRTFVWEEERICKLMDSVMNDYPIGSLLLWKPEKGITLRLREFIKDYVSEQKIPVSKEEKIEEPLFVVLDGQQRLQSLYIAFFGEYNGKSLYFKVDSNPEEIKDELRYVFEFKAPEEIKDSHWRKVSELIKLKPEEVNEFVNQNYREDSEEVKKRIIQNIMRFITKFNIESKINFIYIKEEIPLDDVLEIFVRVNSGGIVLSKSDLLFSTLKVSVAELEGEFIELMDILNGKGEFDFDIDFIIKCSLVVFGRGAKFDLSKVKDEKFLRALRDNFGGLKNAMLSVLNFLKTDAKILSKRFLKSKLALIPLVDFLYREPHQQIPEGESLYMRQYLYMSFFTRFFSHGADGKLDYIHNEIITKSQGKFPVKEIGEYMKERTGIPYEFTESMFRDVDLILNIIQGGVAEIPKKRGWSLERDHIFPASLLREKGIPEELINDIGNLRLITKTRNILKGDRLPDERTEFYGAGDEEIKRTFIQALEMLNEENFRKFVEKRRKLILQKVKEFLGFKN